MLRICPFCKSEFNGRPKSKFCSRSCNNKAYRRAKPVQKAICHPDKPADSFGLCGACYQRARLKNPKAHAARLRVARATHLKASFGISLEQWEKMFELQNGECSICACSIYRYGNEAKHKAASVDHDHITGRVRGLLCANCNRRLVSDHTVDIIRKLLFYLESDFDGRAI